MSERPLSPHLQVYKPQLTSVLSIIHRATGAFLYVVALFVVYWIYVVATASDHFYTINDLLETWVGKIVLYGVLFCVYYHLANGIRHLLWDIGKGLDLKSVYMTGWLVVAFSLGATAMTVWLIMGGAS